MLFVRDGGTTVKNISQLSRLVTVSQLAAFVVGLLYVTGYYINSIFLRNLGIPDMEVFRLEYIKVGFVFWLITLGLVFLPLGCFFLTYRVRKASGLPHYHMGAIGNSLNTVLFFAYPLFLAFLATKYEWQLRLGSPIGPIKTVQQGVVAFMAISSCGVILVPFVERIIQRRAPEGARMWMYRWLMEPLRYGLFAASLYVVWVSVKEMPWTGELATRGVYFVLAGAVFVVGMTAAVLWTRHIEDIRGSGLVYALITFGLAILYYMSITSYVFGILTFVPNNRGGRLPVTEAYLELKDHPDVFTSETTATGRVLYGPVYIVEENANNLYLAADGMDRWLTDFVPIHVVSKTLVPYIRLNRIEDGFPRVNRTASSSGGG